MKRYIVGIDPSGSYNEGKGVTGICVIDAMHKNIINIQTICAVDYQSAEAYWNAHIDLIKDYVKLSEGDLLLSVEDYIIYANKAAAHSNTHCETIQLIGMLKHYAWNNSIEMKLRNASVVKTRWSNDILERKGFIVKRKGKWVTKNNLKLITHSIDALRHAIHTMYFENKGE